MTERTTPAGKYVEVGDLKIHYLELGAGSPLLLLHGGLATSETMWGERLELLAQQYHVFALDSRGHGGTNNPADKLRYDQMADDVAGFIATLHLQAPLVLGYSDGAQVGLELGLRHPQAAAALVLGGVVTRQTPTYLATLFSWGFTGPGQVDLDALEQGDEGFLDEIKKDHSGVYGPDYWRTFVPQVADLWYSVPDYSDEQLASIGTPTLVICGDRDEGDATAESFRLYQLLPHGELSIIPNASHGEAGASPLFWQVVDGFFSRHLNPASSASDAA